VKFSCSKCETKYSIADEIVRGKAVKVRCKKCGNINIVREQKADEPRGEEPTRAVTLDPGMLASMRSSMPAAAPVTQQPSPATARAATAQPAAATRTPPQRMQTGTNIPVARGPVVRPAPTGASMLAAAAEPRQSSPPPVEEWYLAIKGQQVGPMTYPDVENRLARGEVDARTYGWRDGMGDWKRIQDIPEFRALLVKPPPPPVAAPPPFPNQAGAQVVDLQAEIARRKRSQAPAAGDFADAPTQRQAQPGNDQLSSLIDEAAKDLGHADHDPFAAAGGEPTPAAGSPMQARAPGGDPFAGVQDAHASDGPPRESTRMFIAAAGLANRGRKQKIYAGVATLVVGLVGTVLYLDASGIYQIPIVSQIVDVGFAALDVEPPVKRRVVEDDGSGGDYGFLGVRKNKPKPKPRPAGTGLPGDTTGSPDLAGALAGATNTQGGATFERKGDTAVDPGIPVSDTTQSEALKALLNSPDKKKVEVVNPALGKGNVNVTAQTTMGTKAVDTPLSAEQIAKVVADQKSSLTQCANEAAKMGEKYKGTMKVTVAIGPSGKVKKVTVNDPKHAQTRLGECLARALLRWPFPRFQGEEFEAELPLKLTVGQ
jgi:predicted Zn finger-like uncharacterized protein